MKKVDFEAFSGLMATIRNWKPDRARVAWKEFEDDHDTERDNLGPSWSKLRLWLHLSLFGEDRKEDRKGTFEEKSITRMNKAGKMSEEEVALVKKEMAKGFQRPFDSDATVQSMHTALGSDALTMVGDHKARESATSLDLLTAHTGEFMKGTNFPAAVRGGQKRAADSAESSAAPPAKVPRSSSP